MRPVTPQPPPMLGADFWIAAMKRDGHTCWCPGACGRTHVKTGGKCDVDSGRHRLLAAPERPTGNMLLDAAAEPRAWCETCYAGVMRDVRRMAAAVDPPPRGAVRTGPGGRRG